MLKKFLLSLLIAWLSIIGFSNGWSITYNFSVPAWTYGRDTVLFSIPLPVNNLSRPYSIDYSCDFSGAVWTIPGSYRCSMFMAWFIVPDSYTHLTQWSFWGTDYCENYINSNGWHFQGTKNVNITTNWSFISYLGFKIDSSSITLTSPLSVSCTLSWDRINWECPTCPECQECEVCTPQYTSSECQSEYNLIPISDIDSNYCTENDLCTFTGSYSNLVINDIWHESKPFIYVNIPEEIDWDYTGNSYSFTLDVGGYNTDSDYIAWIITTQKSVPDSEDFRSIVINLVPLLVPWFVIILFLYFIFRLIKKLF